MLWRFICGLLAALVVGGTASSAQLEAYGKLPAIELATISPSGASVAFILTNGEDRAIAVQDVAANKISFLQNLGSVKARHLQWAGDRHLIITTSTAVQPSPLDLVAARAERLLAFDLDRETHKLQNLLKHMSGVDMSMNTVGCLPVVHNVDGRPAVFIGTQIFIGSRGQLGLFQVDLEHGFAKLIEEGTQQTVQWLVDPEGRPVAQAVYDDRAGTWTLKLKGANKLWRTAETRQAPINPPQIIGMGRNGKSILVEAEEKDGAGWQEVAIETGARGEFMPLLKEEQPLHDPATGRLIGRVASVGDDLRYTFFDPSDAKVWRAVEKAFAGDRVSLESWSDDRKKIVVRVDSAELGPAYALVDLTTKTADWLGPEYKDLKRADISPVKPIRYRAADGLEITGYLTLPNRREAKSLPLVVLAHGGPASRDRSGFNWWAQALASRGYAVLQANFRGSAGLGEDFLKAGFGQWGRKMQTDLSDGVRELVRQGLVDATRICIAGASYGGYAALAGATIDHGVYRCAASYGGVSDLRGLVVDSRRNRGVASLRYWTRFMGAANIGDPVLARYSPALRAAEADIPVLLIHGKDDTVVPLAQSQQMSEALQQAGKPVQMVVLNGEDHWLSRGETRLAMLKAMVDFLEKNNPPDRAP